MGHHAMSADFRRPTRNLDAFPAEVREWLLGLSGSGEAIVTSCDERDSSVILIRRGSHARTVARWRTVELRILSFQPADRAILTHDRKRKILAIRARPPRARDRRLCRLADRIMGTGSTLSRKAPDGLYSLDPLQKGTFNWDGNEKVRGIVLTRVCLLVPGATEAYLTVSSGDVRRTLQEEIPQLSVEGGELVYARFRFTLEIGGGNPQVSFTIRPPEMSDLPQKRHRNVISEFLREQGVKLS